MPAMPKSDRKMAILARSIDAFDTARELPTHVVSYLMLCVLVLLSRTMFSLINLTYLSVLLQL